MNFDILDPWGVLLGWRLFACHWKLVGNTPNSTAGLSA